MKVNHIILVPETHWDREWYLPFQEFRARLVLLMDKLLDILKNDPNFKNFTLDGQTIPLEDYLEVRPEKKEEIKKYVKEGRLSIGPMYVLPDEFLVSGESLIRNLIIGHQISKEFGKVMKAGYIPDPFGHIAQLPQIISGCEIPSILFMRGFGNEFEENNLNMEFIWNSPGKAASVVGIHLILTYHNLAYLNTKTVKGEFRAALRRVKQLIADFEKYIATPNVLLNNGLDHEEATPEIPQIVDQWNKMYPEILMEQADFEYYIDRVLESNVELKEYQGELRGGRYSHLLSGVLSARMWIKQRNTAIEYLYEKYSEPLSTICWALDKYGSFIYPKNYLLTGLKWLQKNAPHDSICGCSIDEVHNEMKTRYDWAEQIGEEVYKNSFIYLNNLINFNSNYESRNILIVFNPLPWERKDIVEFTSISKKTKGDKLPLNLKLMDSNDKEIEYQYVVAKEQPRFTRDQGISHKISFLTDIPALGYNVYYFFPVESQRSFDLKPDEFRITKNFLENEFYLIEIDSDGFINIKDKETGIVYEKICEFEDVGDWGDEYDFSGPKDNQTDLKFSTEDATLFEKSVVVDGPTQKTFKLRLNLKLPHSLTEDRYNREEWLVDNRITIFISLYRAIKRIEFTIKYENNSRDHRIRVLFPTKIKSEVAHADGHFYVVPRGVELPNSEKWVQKALPTNHQKDFISISNNSGTFAVLNKGLPEYEAIINEDKSVTFAITLLRCVEWLSRDDFATRKSHAGPGYKTPGAQCLGDHTFELSITTESESSWLDSNIHLRGKEFNNPLKPIFPAMVQNAVRTSNKVVLNPTGVTSYEGRAKTKKFESYLPASLSFLNIDNKLINLSALKRAEEGNDIILRVFNISSKSQKANLTFYEKILIKNAKIVNLLEEEPKNEIKAEITTYNHNNLKIELEPNVIVTLKLNYELIE